jgi:predicted CXXCH cytochrome family protein
MRGSARPTIGFQSAARHRPPAFIATLMILATLAGLMSGQNEETPHSGGGQCSTCHLNDPEQAKRQGIDLLMLEDIDTICMRCHEVKPTLSHPSNVMASQKPPETFPLDWAGRITCVTCHYTHRGIRPDVTGYIIRGEQVGRSLCQRCHGSGFDQASHAASLDKSHLASAEPQAGARALLDEISLQCLGCHDGTVARTKSAGLAGSKGAWQHSQIGLSHPIGVEYPPSRNPKQYHPQGLLDSRIQLFEGKLGCATCHGPYSSEKHGLVMSNDRSALCLTCHIK